MLLFSKDRLNHYDPVIIQLVLESGEAQVIKPVNYVIDTAASKIQSG